MSEHGVNLQFEVAIEGQLLGNWTKCDGLGVEYEVQEYQEGGENGFVHRLPGRRKYTNVKLTRPIDKGSARVAAWVSSIGVEVKRQTGKITVRDATGSELGTWNLEGVYPVKWNGPSLDVAGNQVAIETLELAHNGFRFEKGE